VPPLDRVVERRALLLDAALELLGTRGWSAMTVRGVCALARLNARYFYESFPDLDTLAVAVFDRVVDELREAVDSAVAAAGPDPAARIRAMVATTVGFVDSDRRRARVLYVEGRGNERLQRRRLESSSLIADLLAAEARGYGPQRARHRLIAAFLVGGFSELLMRWLDGTVPVSAAELADEATELFLAVGRAGRRRNRPAPA
jgi:AcrR family transcriptional regulator